MKAFVMDSYVSSIGELKGHLRNDAPKPKPAAGEVLVNVYSAALNFFDILQIQGKYQTQPPFPWTPGLELSGVIAKESPIPPGCPFIPGKTRVFGRTQGAYAEQAKANWKDLLEIHRGMRYDEASSLHVTYPTSYFALAIRGNLKAGEWALIHGAAGGVGICAVQIAKALGAKVIASTDSEDKVEIVKKFGGADYAFDCADPTWPQKVLEITGGKGADVIFDPLGFVKPSLKCVAPQGRILVVPANLLLLKNVSVVGVFWGRWQRENPSKIAQVWSDLFKMLELGTLKPLVYSGDRYNGLESLTRGLEALAARKTFGKAVINVREEGGRLRL
ncbi:NAD(P)-binding protein [Meredithblackwellia eburnea MCA 4105]